MENKSILNINKKITNLPPILHEELLNYLDNLIKSEPINSHLKERKVGLLKGKIKLSPDFNNPLNEFQEYM